MRNRTRLLAMALAVAMGATGIPALQVSAGNTEVVKRQTGDDDNIALQTIQQGWSLEDGNWYYYEADFNEWKRLNER